eukprot:5573988-Pyramimonas_sp.AAC.1
MSSLTSCVRNICFRDVVLEISDTGTWAVLSCRGLWTHWARAGGGSEHRGVCSKLSVLIALIVIMWELITL